MFCSSYANILTETLNTPLLNKGTYKFWTQSTRWKLPSVPYSAIVCRGEFYCRNALKLILRPVICIETKIICISHSNFVCQESVSSVCFVSYNKYLFCGQSCVLFCFKGSPSRSSIMSKIGQRFGLTLLTHIHVYLKPLCNPEELQVSSQAGTCFNQWSRSTLHWNACITCMDRLLEQ